jgi:hypothetical protein
MLVEIDKMVDKEPPSLHTADQDLHSLRYNYCSLFVLLVILLFYDCCDGLDVAGLMFLFLFCFWMKKCRIAVVSSRRLFSQITSSTAFSERWPMMTQREQERKWRNKPSTGATFNCHSDLFGNNDVLFSIKKKVLSNVQNERHPVGI